METVPTFGLIVACVAVSAVVILMLASGLFFIKAFKSSTYYDTESYIENAIGTLAFSVVIAALTLLAMWPLKHEYHHWIPKNGVVQKIDKRLVRAGKGMEEKYVVTINDNPYGVSDTRASLIEEGDHVVLMCKKAYEWGSTNHGWDCKWGKHDRRKNDVTD